MNKVMQKIKRWASTDERRWLFVAELAVIKKIPTDSDHDIWAGNNLVFEMFDTFAMMRAFEAAKKNIKAYEAGDYMPQTFVI